MEQRPLRLGDIVDDYCPRERRVTNHVVVALLGETVKQTRCSTCDAEHLFKHARVPARKKKDDIAALETAVLASVNGTQLVARIDPTQTASAPPASETPMTASATTPASAESSEAGTEQADGQPDEPLPGGWMGHRTLIRASLPKTEGELPPPRPIPEFTMHQRQTRGSQGFRGGQGWNRGPRGNFANGNGNGGGHSHGNGPVGERNGNVGGNGSNFGSGFSHGPGGGAPGNGNGQGRPPGQGRHHRHGKHRRPR
jgi:hypothetical protein